MDNTMKPFNQRTFALGIGAAIAGILTSICGLGVMMIRVRLAVVFLGARTLFDMPFNNADAIKVGMVTLVALGVLLSGLGLFAGGTVISLVQVARKKQ